MPLCVVRPALYRASVPGGRPEHGPDEMGLGPVGNRTDERRLPRAEKDTSRPWAPGGKRLLQCDSDWSRSLSLLYRSAWPPPLPLQIGQWDVELKSSIGGPFCDVAEAGRRLRSEHRVLTHKVSGFH